MDKTFNPKEIEKKWYSFWEKNKFFRPKGSGEPYSIVIPPPNVTGTLHLGHALQHSIMDVLIRRARMQGRDTLWQVGTDHAGIATQMVVERKLATEKNLSKNEIGRENFIEEIWKWKKHSGNTITNQMRRLGNSVDWDTERFTMDDEFSDAVIKVFVKLYDEGLIYRGKKLVNWDPKLNTAISDLEVENKPVRGKMWNIKYELNKETQNRSGLKHIIVSTTRPETLLGDTAVAVNPKDKRYENLVGGTALLPLTGREIPIIADDHADMEKGTGCVKITPGHDFNDYEVGQRNNLPMINILLMDGKIRSTPECMKTDGSPDYEMKCHIPDEYHNLDRFDARKKIVETLDKKDYLYSVEDHDMVLPFGDRGGVIIEPMLTNQWYVRMAKLAEAAIELVESKKISFIPSQYQNMYFSWMRNIQDWCISRQLWWGHRIPSWHDKNGNFYVAENESAVREKYNLQTTELVQDDDVLDTWFSSALWTFVTQGWPSETHNLQKYHPTSVLVTGFDIIFFWVARMIMMTKHIMPNGTSSDNIPFHKVYVHGLIRDENGQKMSKAKGNVLDPLDMIDGISLSDLIAKRTKNLMQPQFAEKISSRTRKQFPNGIQAHGTDALRFTLCSLTSTGRDINWDMKRLEGYRNFCNKLWNASRYVLMTCQKTKPSNDSSPKTLPEKWIESILQEMIIKLNDALDNFRFDLATQTIYDFIWNEYCDWFLELSKIDLQDSGRDDPTKQSINATLISTLESILRISHPFLPFITEEIWQNMPRSQSNDQLSPTTLMLQNYPSPDQGLKCQKSENEIDWLKKIVISIRSIRSDMKIEPSKNITIFICPNTNETKQRFLNIHSYICKLAKVAEINYAQNANDAPKSATTVVDELEIFIPLDGNIDVNSELTRLKKEISKLTKEISGLEKKLKNESFLKNAPAFVISKEKDKLSGMSSKIKKLKERVDELC